MLPAIVSATIPFCKSWQRRSPHMPGALPAPSISVRRARSSDISDIRFLIRAVVCVSRDQRGPRIDKRAMETSFAHRVHVKEQPAALIKQGGAGGKEGIEREVLLAGRFSFQGRRYRDRGRGRGRTFANVETLDRVEGAERALRVFSEPPIDPPRQHGSVIAVMNDQRGPPLVRQLNPAFARWLRSRPAAHNTRRNRYRGNSPAQRRAPRPVPPAFDRADHDCSW